MCILLNDFNGDVDTFYAKCYECYINAWMGNPKFRGKIITRNKTLSDRNYETCFWGLCYGHGHDKADEKLDRLEAMPKFSHLLNSINCDEIMHKHNIKWFFYNGKTTIFSEEYVIIVKVTKNSAFLVTGFPFANSYKLKDTERKWRDYWNKIS
jgi:hypothetical protein